VEINLPDPVDIEFYELVERAISSVNAREELFVLILKRAESLMYKTLLEGERLECERYMNAVNVLTVEFMQHMQNYEQSKIPFSQYLAARGLIVEIAEKFGDKSLDLKTS
jgi:hypothetical protein